MEDVVVHEEPLTEELREIEQVFIENNYDIEEYPYWPPLPPDADQTSNIPRHRDDDEAYLEEGEDDVLSDDTPEGLERKYALRERRSSRDPNYFYNYNISIKKALDLYKGSAVKSIVDELYQMVQKRVWKPVYKKQMTKKQLKKRLRSFMFLKEKFLPTGEFERLKARLVAGGHMQDRTVYDTVSSPTVSLTSIFMIAAIAARERRKVRVIDFVGAYLNAYLKEEVLMVLDPICSAILMKVDPTYEEYLDENGSITVKLIKALYGCIESALLWYEHLSNSLLEIGFKQNPQDLCVFNLGEGENQCTFCVYVDDAMITCKDEKIIDDVIEKLTERYEKITSKDGLVHNYIGMTFDFSKEDEVSITMDGYIKEILNSYKVTGTAATPALSYLFEVRESPLLDKERADTFHSRTAKLLYLAKRVRPEILPTVNFLSTRVKNPTEDDWNKLDRCLKYLNGEPSMGIRLSCASNDPLSVVSHVDASYGVHPDGKSHSGMCIALGEGPIYVKSSKQKIVTKSSTEAELVALSDGCSQVIWSREFLLNQGYKVDAATIYQDNMSTIALVDKGRSNSDSTRHINVRYYFIKDRIKSGEVVIKHKPTDLMIADGLTKPLQGRLFRDMRARLLNWFI